MSKSTSIDPATLSSPSPTTTHEDIDLSHEAGPSRKRLRTQCLTTDERREARAHRNRIAAQNSRDRRKAQFVYLERRVAELEEENRLLRATVGLPFSGPSASLPSSSKSEEEHLRDERDRERERENEELKERVRTLERGWDVIKALAQGLPGSISSFIAPTPTTTTPPADTMSSLPASTKETSSNPNLTAFPSPAPSDVSQESDPASTPTTLPDAPLYGPVQVSELKEAQSHVRHDSTRHLARVASIESPSLVSSMALQRVVSLPVSMPSSILPPYLRAIHLKHINTLLDPRAVQKMATTMLWKPSSTRSSCRHLRVSRLRTRRRRRLKTLRK